MGCTGNSTTNPYEMQQNCTACDTLCNDNTCSSVPPKYNVVNSCEPNCTISSCTSWQSFGCGALGYPINDNVFNCTACNSGCNSGSCNLITTTNYSSQGECLASSSAVSWWTFDDGTANDFYGRNNGIINNANCNVAGRNGKGKACYFNGASSIYTSASNTLNSQNMTFAFWLNIPTGNPDYTTLFYTKVSNPGSYSDCYFDAIIYGSNNANKMRCRIFQYAAQSYQLDVGASPFSYNAWNFVVCEYTGTTAPNPIGAFNNGVLLGSGGTTLANGGCSGVRASALYIGVGGSLVFSAGKNLTGTIDEFMVFNRTLSSTEVQSIYNYLQ